MSDTQIEIKVTAARGRLDTILAAQLPEISRTAIQNMIRARRVRVNGTPVEKAAFEVQFGDSIRVEQEVERGGAADPVTLPSLDILFEDGALLVVNKISGIVVHASPGHEQRTLVRQALAHAPELAEVGDPEREGLVHRLDKDTSGVIVFAKTEAALTDLQAQFKARSVKKNYLALLDGAPPTPAGRVEAPIGRDPKNRKRFAVLPAGRGREAVSEYRVADSFEAHSQVAVVPLTGRTHQVRLHMRFLGCPVVGDIVYGRNKPTLDVKRHQLHARRLELVHPDTGEDLEFNAPIPEDMREAIEQAKSS